MSQPKLFKFLLVGLPVGLAVTIVIALGLYYTEPGRDGPSKDEALRFARPVTESDLKDTVLRLSATVGARSLQAEPEAMGRARKFVQSSLSSDNMGYDVGLHARKIGQIDCPSVVAELSGRGRSSELIIVAAPYTSAVASPGAGRSASGIASLLSIAKAMTGSEQQRTVQFVAYASDTADPTRHDLSQAVGLEEGCAIIAVLDLDTIVFPVREGGVWEVEVPMIIYTNEDAVANDVVSRFARSTGLRFTVNSVPDLHPGERSLVPVLTLVSDVPESPAGSADDLPDAYDYSRFTQTVQKLQQLVQRLANPDGV